MSAIAQGGFVPGNRTVVLGRDGDELVIPLLPPSVLRSAEVVHAAPLPGDGGLMPCCGRTPFEVPANHRMTFLNAVTCTVRDLGPVFSAGQEG